MTIYPAVRYRDADAGLEFLTKAFAAEQLEVHRDPGGRIAHAELGLGDGIVMLGEYSDEGWLGGHAPDPLGSTVSLYISVPHPTAHHDRARAAGAEIVRELVDTPYGSREYSVRDPEGNLWSFGTYDPAASRTRA
jgi:uncharacterized glyoxalase superfamily protein PhnB